MNSDMLDLVLDDNKTYQDASKEMFLTELREVFKQFKSENNSFLVPHPGACSSAGCNKGKGYSFVGNNSPSHLDLIFEGTDNEVTDIYGCCLFQLTDAEFELGNKISLHIADDQKATFTPTLEYHYIVQQCELAFEEIQSDCQGLHDKEYCLNWLEKFSALNDKMPDPFISYSKMNRFQYLYYHLSNICVKLKHDKQAKQALQEYKGRVQLKKENENSFLLNWLMKHEDAGKELIDLISIYGLNEAKANSHGYFALPPDYNIRLFYDDYRNIHEFAVLFNELYWPELEKYRQLSINELYNLDLESEEFKNMNSLKYLVEKKGI